MIEITVEQLLAKIGALTLQLEHAERENQQLRAELAQAQAAEQ